MLRHLLTDAQEELLAEERRRLAELSAALARFDAAAEDQKTLAGSIARLDELFLLVVAGEFNAGKSAFLNALLGRRLLEEGVTPTTQTLVLLRHGEQVARRFRDDGVEVVTAPVPLLREIAVVDTPGTNAIARQHEALTREFIPNADLVLFVTSADRPFTESERAFLGEIREWGKKVVFVLNKIDILDRPEDVERIEAFIAEGAQRLLGFTPAIFPVSAKRALAVKEAGGPGPDEAGDLAAAARFAALEAHLATALEEAERLRTKLASPLGVGRRLAERYLGVAKGRLELLAADLATLDDIDRQLTAYAEDMRREFRFRLADVEKVLGDLEARGIAFFDDTLRLGRVFDLLRKERVQADFERQVVGEAPQRIETKVGEVIDWMVAAELRQWQAVLEHLARRQHAHADRIVGRAGGAFDLDRGRLLERVGGAARRTVASYDRRAEGQRLAESVQTAVAGAALLEVGAVGLGAAVALVATSTAADLTGVLAASALAAIGLFVIPARRRQAKSELRTRIGELTARLRRALTEPFDDEIERSLGGIGESTAPYSRFVRSERDRLAGACDEFATLMAGLDSLARRI